MSDIDKAKFRALFENGLLTARPPEVWLPQESKDGEWKNHFIGSTGVPMHLSGGWMINESTGSLKQVDIDDIDFSPTNISDYTIARNDRFSDGAWAQLFESGDAQKLYRRLLEIEESHQ